MSLQGRWQLQLRVPLLHNYLDAFDGFISRCRGISHLSSHSSLLRPSQFQFWCLCVIKVFNPFTAPDCKISGLKNAHNHACKQYIWWSCNNSTFSAWILIEVLSRTCAQGGKKTLYNWKFDSFIGRFSSDDAASMAAKGLRTVLWIAVVKTVRR